MENVTFTIAHWLRAGRCEACGTRLEVGDEATTQGGGEILLCGLGCEGQARVQARRNAEYEAWLDSQDGAPDAGGMLEPDPDLVEQYTTRALRKLEQRRARRAA